MNGENGPESVALDSLTYDYAATRVTSHNACNCAQCMADRHALSVVYNDGWRITFATRGAFTAVGPVWADRWGTFTYSR